MSWNLSASDREMGAGWRAELACAPCDRRSRDFSKALRMDRKRVRARHLEEKKEKPTSGHLFFTSTSALNSPQFLLLSLSLCSFFVSSLITPLPLYLFDGLLHPLSPPPLFLTHPPTNTPIYIRTNATLKDRKQINPNGKSSLQTKGYERELFFLSFFLWSNSMRERIEAHA